MAIVVRLSRRYSVWKNGKQTRKSVVVRWAREGNYDIIGLRDVVVTVKIETVENAGISFDGFVLLPD